jgi:putative SOS response-associated peptidase YedK
MCGRYTLYTPVETLAEEFGLTGPLPNLQPNYNVAPTQEVPAVVAGNDGGRRLEMLRWGLISSWAEDPGIGSQMINARSETVAEKPSFRRAFKERRCLIPADGFYEWQKTNGSKQPYHVWMEGERPFAFAGLWESWNRSGGEEIRSYTILTTGANEFMNEIHHRMPVILPPDDYELWLDPDVHERDLLLPLLAPYAGEMEAYPVGRKVNSPSNNEPGCVERVA